MNSIKNLAKVLAAGITITAAISQAFAGPAIPIDITRVDSATAPSNGFNGGPFTWGTQPAGTGEDNETERVPGLQAVPSQEWDLEAITLHNTTMSLVGGWDFKNFAGLESFHPGDLFIKVGGSAPSVQPINNGAGNEPNTTYGYTYVVQLSTAANFGKVINLTTGPAAVFHTVAYDAFLSNPWTYYTGGTAAGTTVTSYASARTASQVGTLTGVSALNNLRDDSNSGALVVNSVYDTSPSHNVLDVDLSFLGNIAAGTAVYFHYTMECGNDSIRGQYAGGFDRLPDSGSSLALIGMGLAALAAVGRLRRQKK